MALGAKNGARRAFGGDVSNTKEMTQASRDDSSVVGKAAPQQADKPALSQPAQRHTSMSGIKGVLNTVTAKPVNPAGKAQNTGKYTKRNNVIFRDQLEPVVEKESSKEYTHEAWKRGLEQPAIEKSTIEAKRLERADQNDKETESAIIEEEVQRLKEYLRCGRTSPTYSDTTISENEESKDGLKKPAAVASELDVEEWEDAEEDSHAAPAFPSRTDNTTGGTTTVLYPKITAATKLEIIRAKDMVEGSRSEEDILEDFYDSSMVAEYSSEIFLHLRTREVSCAYSCVLFLRLTNFLDCYAPRGRLHDQPVRDPVVHALRADGLACAGALPLRSAPGDALPLRQLHRPLPLSQDCLPGQAAAGGCHCHLHCC